MPFLTDYYRSAINDPRLTGMGGKSARAGGRKAPLFGKLLERLRLAKFEDRGRESFELVAAALRDGEIATLAPSTIYRYESEGRVPDILSIKGLASLYGLEHWESLGAALLADLEGSGVSVDNLEAIARAAGSARSVTESSVPLGQLASSRGNEGQLTERACNRVARFSFQAPDAALRINPDDVEGPASCGPSWPNAFRGRRMRLSLQICQDRTYDILCFTGGRNARY
jgi:hypothetical protein